MTVDEVDQEYSALLDHIEGAQRQYQSFPRPDALGLDEEHLHDSRAKHRLGAVTRKARLLVERLLEAFRSNKTSEGEESPSSSECDDIICLGRVWANLRTNIPR